MNIEGKYMKKLFSGLALLGILLAVSCQKSESKKADQNIKVEEKVYTIKNAKGMTAKITNYGGIVMSLMVADKDGKFSDVVLGHDKIDTYKEEGKSQYFGCITGRYCNRIANGKFKIGDKEYTLAKNNGENHLHGGVKGFDKVVWTVKEITDNKIVLTYTSPDGEEGYPGKLSTTVTYEITEENELKIDYKATTDKETVVNLTHHSYFNLRPKIDGEVVDHIFQINADKFTPTDAGGIPTGELASVEGTPFDFRTATAIAARVGDDNEQLKFGKGYDHNFVLNNQSGKLALAATVTEPTSGRIMEVLTTDVGLQLYIGNYLNGIEGKNGDVYKYRYGFCLEAQKYPDTPNKSNFPSCALKPGETYTKTTIYRFKTK